MCGILGMFALAPNCSLPIERGREALKCLEPRGPDDTGEWSSDGIWFAHRRLAILDPAHARQPWVCPENGGALTFNGEIYNFRKLRSRDPDLRGRSVASTGDTAVLAELLSRDGAAAVDQLRGMFAFAWFDPRKRQLLLVRDRLGIKPLYYAQSENIFYFASTVSALLRIAEVPRKADGVAVTHYLATARSHLGSRTLFAGVSTVQPGEMVVVGRDVAGAVHRVKYWSPPIFAEDEKDSSREVEAVTRCRELVCDAVCEQMVSDVPLGIFVSGGLDSSVIAGALPDQCLKELFAFNVGYERENYNEWEYARMIAEARGIRASFVSLGESDRWSDLTELIGRNGLPLSTPNEIAIWKLAQAFAAEGKVALTGEGADEIFGGYPIPCLGALDFDRSIDPHTAPGIQSALVRFYGRSRFASRADHYLSLHSWTRRSKRDQWFCNQWLEQWSAEDRILEEYESLFAPLAKCATLEAHLHLHARINLEGLLSRVDSSTMAASVEARVPFTDHRLVEWAFTIPTQWKASIRESGIDASSANSIAVDWVQEGRFVGKHILREAFRDAVPHSILQRPKVSFPSPFIESMNGAWRERAEETLRSSDALRNWLKVPAHLLLGEGISSWLWINLALWAETWDVH